MSGLLSRLAARAVGRSSLLAPAVPSLFEPTVLPALRGVESLSHEGEPDATRDTTDLHLAGSPHGFPSASASGRPPVPTEGREQVVPIAPDRARIPAPERSEGDSLPRAHATKEQPRPDERVGRATRPARSNGTSSARTGITAPSHQVDDHRLATRRLAEDNEPRPTRQMQATPPARQAGVRAQGLPPDVGPLREALAVPRAPSFLEPSRSEAVASAPLSMPVVERLRILRESVNVADPGTRMGPPVVRLTIGRVEIRGTPAAQPFAMPATAPATLAPRLTLAEYLSGKRTIP